MILKAVIAIRCTSFCKFMLRMASFITPSTCCPLHLQLQWYHGGIDHAHVCVCVCVRVGERERGRERGRDRDRERERERMCEWETRLGFWQVVKAERVEVHLSAL